MDVDPVAGMDPVDPHVGRKHDLCDPLGRCKIHVLFDGNLCDASPYVDVQLHLHLHGMGNQVCEMVPTGTNHAERTRAKEETLG